MATGHYAIAKDGGIFRSVCEEKDQSYFMYRLNPNDVRLGKFLFPLGEFDKNWVRKTARCMGLCVCEKKESQDICFVKGNYLNYTGYGCSGNILNTSGKKIGEHNGICQFTIGKRKGFGSFGKEPMYVVDFNNNDIIVGTKNNLFNKNKLFLTDVVWHKIPLSGSNLIVQQLYHGRKMNAKIMLESQNVEIVFTDCLTYSPYGQSLVIYDGDRVIGGGIITKDPY
jgi:tRNA-specific 2-thiouridylase